MIALLGLLEALLHEMGPQPNFAFQQGIVLIVFAVAVSITLPFLSRRLRWAVPAAAAVVGGAFSSIRGTAVLSFELPHPSDLPLTAVTFGVLAITSYFFVATSHR